MNKSIKIFSISIKCFCWLLIIILLAQYASIFYYKVYDIIRSGAELRASYNVVPFSAISFYIERWFADDMNHSIILSNLLGPFVFLMPLGFLLPIVFIQLRSIKKIFLIAFSFSTFIELFQLFSHLGKCDVDDVILNMLGMGLGCLVFLLCFKCLTHRIVYKGTES